MVETTVTVRHRSGLHARPLAQFVQLAQQFEATIQVTNETRQKGPANGTSAVHLLLLAVLPGHAIKIEATGPEGAVAVAALRDLVESNFGEPAAQEAK